MTCDEARGAFSDLYDEAISGAPLVTITQHLASCPSCREEWAAFRKAMQAVSDLGGAEPSPGFTARVRQRIEAPHWGHRVVQRLFFPLRVKVPIQALALLVVAFAGLLLYQRSPELRREAEFRPAPPPPSETEVPHATPPPPAPPIAEAPAPSLPQQAPLEMESDRAPSALRDEAKPLEKPAAPAEPPKAEEPARELRAEPAEPGVSAGRLQQAAPSPAESGSVALPAQPAPKSLATPHMAPRPSVAPTPAKEAQTSSLQPRSADDLYSTALAESARQRHDRAIDEFRAFIAQHPRDARLPEARLRLADAYVAQQRFTDAIPEYEALAREFPDSPLRPAALYREAQARLAVGDQAGCQRLRELTDRYPQSPEAPLARQAISLRCP
jgi:TolA-binding protein